MEDLTEAEKIIIARLLNIADHSDFFEEDLPKGSKTLKSVWDKIASIRKKLVL